MKSALLEVCTGARGLWRVRECIMKVVTHELSPQGCVAIKGRMGVKTFRVEETANMNPWGPGKRMKQSMVSA